MWIAEKWQDYELLDCGDGEKLERPWGCHIYGGWPAFHADSAVEQRKPAGHGGRGTAGKGGRACADGEAREYSPAATADHR